MIRARLTCPLWNNCPMLRRLGIRWCAGCDMKNEAYITGIYSPEPRYIPVIRYEYERIKLDCQHPICHIDGDECNNIDVYGIMQCDTCDKQSNAPVEEDTVTYQSNLEMIEAAQLKEENEMVEKLGELGKLLPVAVEIKKVTVWQRLKKIIFG
jgi:hypothetical protein